MSTDGPRLDRICLIAMKGTLDRLDSLLSRGASGSRPTLCIQEGQAALSPDNKLMIPHADLKAIRDDLWSVWFELNGRVE